MGLGPSLRKPILDIAQLQLAFVSIALTSRARSPAAPALAPGAVSPGCKNARCAFAHRAFSPTIRRALSAYTQIHHPPRLELSFVYKQAPDVAALQLRDRSAS